MTYCIILFSMFQKNGNCVAVYKYRDEINVGSVCVYDRQLLLFDWIRRCNLETEIEYELTLI